MSPTAVVAVSPTKVAPLLALDKKMVDTSRPFRTVRDGRRTALIFTDNSVVLADSASCRVEAVYPALAGHDMHPMVAKQLQSVLVAADSCPVTATHPCSAENTDLSTKTSDTAEAVAMAGAAVKIVSVVFKPAKMISVALGVFGGLMEEDQYQQQIDALKNAVATLRQCIQASVCLS